MKGPAVAATMIPFLEDVSSYVDFSVATSASDGTTKIKYNFRNNSCGKTRIRSPIIYWLKTSFPYAYILKELLLIIIVATNLFTALVQEQKTQLNIFLESFKDETLIVW